MTPQVIDATPLWLLYLASTAIFFAGLELGVRLGLYRRRTSEGATPEAMASGVTAALLGLVAFLLAFTFGMAQSRYEARRQRVVDEANAVGTAYLRAQLIPEPNRKQSMELLQRYVDTRLRVIEARREDVAPLVEQSEAIHRELWAQASDLARSQPITVITGLFVQSLNVVIDLHALRVTVGVRNRVPASIWATLYVVGFLGMVTLGYQNGLAGSRGAVTSAPLVLAFATVLLLVTDLDRPRQTLFKVGQDAMVDLRASMRTQPP
jgi:hypothetical protein